MSHIFIFSGTDVKTFELFIECETEKYFKILEDSKR